MTHSLIPEDPLDRADPVPPNPRPPSVSSRTPKPALPLGPALMALPAAPPNAARTPARPSETRRAMTNRRHCSPGAIISSIAMMTTLHKWRRPDMSPSAREGPLPGFASLPPKLRPHDDFISCRTLRPHGPPCSSSTPDFRTVAQHKSIRRAVRGHAPMLPARGRAQRRLRARPTLPPAEGACRRTWLPVTSSSDRWPALRPRPSFTSF